ncbi:MAG: dTDP-4-dehydrorhamnose 3,5-epimerase family protein [Gemmatimonadetes bacterium]|nr:dTDP-4-dehydrorhamnose 3,5-epimerase family protein [Gemmatimonadota bacterium]
MKIETVESLVIPELKVVRFGRFRDDRGYFTESYRLGDLSSNPETAFLRDVRFLQINESFSRAGVVRGLHFQWNPHMGKLVRAVRGRIVDLALDIRLGSPTLGKIVARDISEEPDVDHAEWIWVPPGFAHGFFCLTDCLLEYLCSGEYSPGNEAGISPLATDLDWSLCDRAMKRAFDEIVTGEPILSEKDRDAFTLNGWLADARSSNFMY